MGMISRVRGRIRSDSFSKIQLKSEDKMANIVWLLSVVLILPYWAPRGLLVALGGAWLMAAYTCLVVPVLISANYRYPASWYPHAVKLARRTAKRLRPPVVFLLDVIKAIYAPLERAEQVFIQMNNLSTMICQLLIFAACDRLFVAQGKLTSLYSLMFYNVITYSVNYVREICTKEDWSPYVNVTRHSQVKHLAMSATKIVLEWTKAVTFIVTITFILLTLGLEQGLEHFRPTVLYTFITGTYYLLSEKTFLEIWPPALTALKIESLEGMEPLYCNVWARGITTALAVPLVPALIWYERLRLALLVLYICVFVHGRYRLGEALKKLNEARDSLSRFRRATPEELSTLEDVCAVCLGSMKSARVTPCAHFFHADCLRRCLATTDRCPICVRPYVFC
ncbi:zinc finger, c3HC4 type (RING finger) domain-containing protein [Phthorimaea operculella]|nr:zinc finger, c3HC4 type (RING finger) domain-containing protein [Phthorimaea operculella]